ncbi:uncharacterized protein MELLADRAFT_92725 [Melampsora larici-populina 98AG31]|uniref:BED-type domain-containing protein n=1 Tax=Melampsora larici-populina (strain 98AG31 / pathotype 3-4-7) TaxID=747676 RepID=F4S2V4_MELLP|nr:uncharacterized protein MELLADRAFT_92725 [Melampsora larici-populina 98AG31]EGG01124.1 hypothetical protein MELLADRAFT_92725 [Melampsora larici-populina 98AG31]
MPANTSQSSSEVSQDTIAKRARTLYVWCHFTIEDNKTICSVVLSSGKVCGKALARDRTSSTKAMSDHLQ